MADERATRADGAKAETARRRARATMDRNILVVICIEIIKVIVCGEDPRHQHLQDLFNRGVKCRIGNEIANAHPSTSYVTTLTSNLE